MGSRDLSLPSRPRCMTPTNRKVRVEGVTKGYDFEYFENETALPEAYAAKRVR